MIKFCKEYPKITVVIVAFILIILFTILLIFIKNPNTIKITYDGDSEIGKKVQSEIEYKVEGGISISANYIDELLGAASGITKVGEISNNLKVVATEALAQNKAKKTEKLVIPTNAWCKVNTEGVAFYKWTENSSNYLEIIHHKENNIVLIIKSMGFHITIKRFGGDVLVYKVM